MKHENQHTSIKPIEKAVASLRLGSEQLSSQAGFRCSPGLVAAGSMHSATSPKLHQSFAYNPAPVDPSSTFRTWCPNTSIVLLRGLLQNSPEHDLLFGQFCTHFDEFVAATRCQGRFETGA